MNSVDQNGVSKETVIRIIAIVIGTILITALIVFWKCVTLKQKKKRMIISSIIGTENSGNNYSWDISHTTNTIMKAMQADIDEATVNCDWTVKLEKKLGEGDFGIVYRATMKKDNSTTEVGINLNKYQLNYGTQLIQNIQVRYCINILVSMK